MRSGFLFSVLPSSLGDDHLSPETIEVLPQLIVKQSDRDSSHC